MEVVFPRLGLGLANGWVPLAGLGLGDTPGTDAPARAGS